tara:strand:- start:2761 stop:3240 length:480 start_codon:yes stop_codon:yes gene_type:complete
MKSTVLIAAIVAGISLTALDASAAGRGEPREMPDFATLDADGNGSLSVAELETARTSRFAEMDTDGNGAISLEELTAAQAHMAVQRAEQMLSRMDANEDGALQADEMKPRGASAERMLSRIDADDDGEISEEEFDKAGEKREERGDRGERGGKGHGRRG